MWRESGFFSIITPDMETKYEIVGLFPTKTNDILAEKTLVNLCRGAKFKVVDVDKWGIKNLAYPIKKETKGYYLRLVIEGGDARALLNALKVDEDLLRYLLVRLPEKKGVATKEEKKNERKKSK